MLGFACKSFFFTVNASAILLTVHTQGFRSGNPLFPPLPEILIIKPYTHRLCHILCNGLNQFVLLKFTVKKCRGKIIELAAFRNEPSCFQPGMITVKTSRFFAKRCIPQEFFQIVTFLINDTNPGLLSIILKCVFSSLHFCVWVNVVWVEKCRDRKVPAFQNLQRINGAGSTTSMQ